VVAKWGGIINHPIREVEEFPIAKIRRRKLKRGGVALSTGLPQVEPHHLQSQSPKLGAEVTYVLGESAGLGGVRGLDDPGGGIGTPGGVDDALHQLDFTDTDGSEFLEKWEGGG
jgi:hypothetical protein